MNWIEEFISDLVSFATFQELLYTMSEITRNSVVEKLGEVIEDRHAWLYGIEKTYHYVRVSPDWFSIFKVWREVKESAMERIESDGELMKRIRTTIELVMDEKDTNWNAFMTTLVDSVSEIWSIVNEEVSKRRNELENIIKTAGGFKMKKVLTWVYFINPKVIEWLSWMSQHDEKYKKYLKYLGVAKP